MPSPAELVAQVEQLDDLEWYDFLDALDEAAKRRSDHINAQPDPDPNDLPAVAAWLARSSLVGNPATREVHYLPNGTPPGELRFVEVGRSPFIPEPLRPIKYFADLRETQVLVSTIDVSVDQWQEIQDGNLPLPAGWSLDGVVTWGRRA